jgi:ATP-binding cassette subfamily F protein 3
MSPSDLLLLDEPTNHLDLDAMFWLESWLLSYPGTLLVIAHDRDFLDTVCTDIVHLEHNQARSYKGNYSSFERQRAETLALQASVHKKQQHQAAHLQQFIDRFRSKATKARQVQGRIKALERLTAAAPAHADSPYTFSFPNPLKMSNPLLTLRDGALGYAGQSVLREVRLDVHPAARIGVLGANGAGKSTLMKTLANELAPIAGDLQRGAHSAIGYFAQQQLEQLDGSRSPLALLGEVPLLQGKQGEQPEQQRRNYLGSWGFIGDMVKRPSETLSGGERARLVLALIAWQRPALLILDEPTNHLDLEMRHTLSIALQDYKGAMILVSHDRELLARTVDEYWLVAHGHVREFKGDLDAYRDLVQSRLAHPENTFDDKNNESKKGRRRAAAERRRESEPLRKRIKQLDAQIRRLNDSLAELDTTLADVGAYERLSGDELNQLLAAQGEQRRDLESAEQAWLESHEALESVTDESRV